MSLVPDSLLADRTETSQMGPSSIPYRCFREQWGPMLAAAAVGIGAVNVVETNVDYDVAVVGAVMRSLAPRTILACEASCTRPVACTQALLGNNILAESTVRNMADRMPEVAAGMAGRELHVLVY